MSSLVLKLLAIVLMSIDHIGLVLLDDNQVFRFIGRAAFPIFAFLLVEGFKYTKDDKKRVLKYIFRIFILAILTEVIYDKVFFNTYIYPLNQNILFTLSLGLVLSYIYERNSYSIISKIISMSIIFYISILSIFLYLDYNIVGLFLMFGFYFINKTNKKNIFYILLIIIYMFSYSFMYGHSFASYGILLSIIPIILYNGNKGYSSKLMQYLFYLYYPFHLIILLILKAIM